MEWWPLTANSCVANGQAAETNVQFVPGSALDHQLPPLLEQNQHHQQHQQHQHQQQQQHQHQHQQNQSTGDFDPWLACDDLELGTIIQQVSSGVVGSPSCSDASIKQTPLLSGRAKQGELYVADSNILPSPQSRCGPESKQQIISIINNSLPPGYQHSSGQQQQRRNNSITTSSSIAASPLSSSLGSSPLNSLSSNYSLLSPHSPALSSYNQQTAQQHQQQEAIQTYRFGSNDEFHLQHHQHAQTFDGSTGRLVIPISGPSTITSTHGTINSAQASAKLSVGSNRYNLSKTTVASSQLQNAGLRASLLLTHNKPQTKAPTRQPRKTPNSIAEVSNLGAQGHKQRRCRHITDFVLAEEEKRLLIKEGHSSFPMDCQLRPLTKMEERILRKIRRKIRNKKSAQCSRQRKKEYVEELERKYSETLRENIELKQLLAKIHSSSSEHHQEHQFQVVPVGKNEMQAFSDDCAEAQTSCGSDSVEMHWKDLFQSESVADRSSGIQRQQP